jgi:hypothetical protein
MGKCEGPHALIVESLGDRRGQMGMEGGEERCCWQETWDDLPSLLCGFGRALEPRSPSIRGPCVGSGEHC